MSHKLVAPLKFHGGKHYLADWLISLMPPHSTYSEPFFGGGHVLLAKNPEGINEVVNDTNSYLIYFWGMLRNQETFYAFHRKLEATPFSEEAYKIAKDRLEHGDYERDYSGAILMATDYFILARQSLAARGNSFASLSVNRTRRGMNEQVSAWLTAVDGLPAVHKRLIRLMTYNEDFAPFIKRCDSKETLFYCDPPYLKDTRVSKKAYGPHEMSDDDHIRLLKILEKIKGKFILSGYDNKIYNAYAKKNKWRKEKFKIPNNAAGGKKKRIMVECAWMNYQNRRGEVNQAIARLPQ